MADDNMGSDSEEVILSEDDHQSGDLLSASGEEELDAGVHEEAAMDIPRAAEEDFSEEAEEEQPEAQPAAPQPAAAAVAEEPAPVGSSGSAPSQPQQQQEASTAESAAPPKPAGLGLGASLGGPRGLGGLGLKPPAPKAAEPQQQPQQQQQQQPQPAQQPAQQQPKGLGLGGLGLGPKLPAKQPAASTSSSAAANGTATPPAEAAGTAAQPAAAGGPPKPAGGVGLLPPKPKAAAAAGDSAATSSSSSTPAAPQQQQQPAKPAGGLGSLPARQPAGGVPALGPRPAAAGGSSSSGQPGSGGASAFRPQLGPRPAVTAGAGGQPGAAVVRAPAAAAAAAVAAAGGQAGGVVDPEEPKSMQKMRQKLQELRVDSLRAGMRLGYAATSEQLQQWLSVLERIEKVNAPPLRRRVDVNRLALAEATERNSSSTPDSPLDIHIKMLVVGMTGTGKSELINALLGRPAQATNAFRESTKRVKVVKGRIAGMAVTAIDTPGLHASADAQSANRSLLKSIKAAWKKHKPNFLIYVDRLDATRPSFGEMGLLSNITATLGQGAWKKAIVVLTHANAAREKLGREYMTVVKQRKNIVTNIIRQAAGEMQLRINLHSVDTHPETPRTPGGEMLVYDQVTPMALTPTPVPWRPALLLNMLGLYAFETGVELIQKATPKPKASAAKQQDMFKQMMRSRLPPTSYFVEQLVEGVAKPEGWAVPEDPFAAETDDEEAEEFKHIYYKIMYSLAKKGDARAQKEYAAWLRKLDKNKRAYQEAYENEEIEQLAAYGYEGYVTEALDLGPSFDPEDNTDHRYMYPIADSQIAIMPTLDYYGYEHEDAITGFVAEWSGQPWNVDGWGGVPVDVTATVEKDKTTTCVQAEANASIVHSVAPFGNRHITQLSGAFELLRPNVKDILYTLEMNTFKDGMLGRNDHAGAGLMLTRMAEGGNIKKGPVGVGVRIQENMRVGPLKVEAVAAQVRGETPMGGRDEGWAARAFVLHDWVPGLAMNFDWYQERTKDESSTIGGWATALGYDFGLPGGYPAAMEVDWVSGSDIVHVDASLYAPYDWKPAWLLLIPAVNWAKDWWRRWRDSRRGVVEEEEVEEEEEDGGMMGGADLGAMLQGMSGPDAQAMLQQLMQSGGLQQLMGGAR